MRTNTEKNGQMVLPSAITSKFTAECNLASSGIVAAGTGRDKSFPAFSYNGQTLRTEWQVAPEQDSCAVPAA